MCFVLAMQAEAAPRFSIIVPTRNEAADIAATLRALLALEHAAFEVLVVDDSTDGTREIVRSFAAAGVRCLEQGAQRGRAAARNTGMRAACGEILVILNADVHLPRDFLRRLEAHYAAGADYVLVENAIENIEYLLPRYMQAQHSYQYGVDTAVNMNWTEGFSCRRQAALDAGLQPEGGVVPLVAGEDGWFGERLQARGFRKVFDRSLVATHVAPAQWRSFWAQRVGRGQGTAQMWRQREHNSLVVLALRTVTQTLINAAGILLLLPAARRAWLLSRLSPCRNQDLLPFFVAGSVEAMANLAGIWHGCIEAVRAGDD